MKSEFSLAGQKIVVTGASGGIGGAISASLVRAGAEVACAARTTSSATAAADRLAGLGVEAKPISADLSVDAEVDGLIPKAAEVLGGLDGLVNAAGIQLRKPALDVSRTDFRRMCRVNLEATFLLCRAAAPVFLRGGGGSIINVTSLTARFGLSDLAVYSATRGGGVNQMSRALAVEWASAGIRVNAIAPGRIRTTMTEELFADDARRVGFEAHIPMGRGGEPSDVGGVAAFLMSSAAAYMTGQTIYVDGGWSASGSLGG